MIDTMSPTWRTITDNCNALIEVLRNDLERRGLSAADTEHLRGQIFSLRAVLEMPNALTDNEDDSERQPAPYFY